MLTTVASHSPTHNPSRSSYTRNHGGPGPITSSVAMSSSPLHAFRVSALLLPLLCWLACWSPSAVLVSGQYLVPGNISNFESPAVNGYAYTPTQSSLQPWLYGAQGGIATLGSPWAPGLPVQAPTANQYSYLQTAPQPTSNMSTTITNLLLGQTYNLSFWWGVRSSSGVQTYSKIGGVLAQRSYLPVGAESVLGWRLQLCELSAGRVGHHWLAGVFQPGAQQYGQSDPIRLRPARARLLQLAHLDIRLSAVRAAQL